MLHPVPPFSDSPSESESQKSNVVAMPSVRKRWSFVNSLEFSIFRIMMLITLSLFLVNDVWHTARNMELIQFLFHIADPSDVYAIEQKLQSDPAYRRQAAEQIAQKAQPSAPRKDSAPGSAKTKRGGIVSKRGAVSAGAPAVLVKTQP
jgi:hypothetical protein